MTKREKLNKDVQQALDAFEVMPCNILYDIPIRPAKVNCWVAVYDWDNRCFALGKVISVSKDGKVARVEVDTIAENEELIDFKLEQLDPDGLTDGTITFEWTGLGKWPGLTPPEDAQTSYCARMLSGQWELLEYITYPKKKENT